MTIPDLLITGCDALICEDDGRYAVLPDRDIAIAVNRIQAIVLSGQIGQAREVINAAGMLAIPGLINCHTHGPMVLFRGLAEERAH